jgi:aryl-alcohol dehydrogenase-like predicted oxidoreductase
MRASASGRALDAMIRSRRASIGARGADGRGRRSALRFPHASLGARTNASVVGARRAARRQIEDPDMSMSESSRREFLRVTAAASAAISFAGLARARSRSAAQSASPAGKATATQANAMTTALERRKFGKTDMSVAVLGFGGAEIGYEKTDQETVAKLLNAALDAGLNVVDTAECYIDSEVAIGSAIGSRRKEYYLFTKCGHIVDGKTNGSDWSKSGILKSIERSLTRLKTDALDLVQLHSCGLDELKKGECIEALEQAKKDGKTRYIGYSGDSTAAKYAVECGRFDSLQTSVNICDQECIDLTLPLAREKNMGVIAKRPIANAVWRYDAKPDNGYHSEYWSRLQELKYDFAMGDAKNKDGPDGAAAIAMRFTAMQPAVDVLIVGTSKPSRWKQNADLMKAGPLPKELAESIRKRWRETAKSDWIGQT